MPRCRPDSQGRPTLSLTGYELGLAKALAFSEDDPRLSPLRDLAAAHSMTLIVGAPVRIESRVYIGAFILLPNHTSDPYTKHHLGAFSPAASCDGTVPPPASSWYNCQPTAPALRS